MTKPEVWLESTHTLSGGGRGRTGVGHYTEECISHTAAASPDYAYTVVGNVFAAIQPHLPKLSSNNVKFRLCRLFPGKLWNQLLRWNIMPPLNWLIPGRPDVVVFFNFVRYPLTPGVKSIVTVHDLVFKHYPERVKRRNQSYLERFVPEALVRADHLIAVSEYTKQDMAKTYGVALEKISVVAPGVDLQRYRPGLNGAAVREKLSLPEHYFLFVSTIEPRKNIPTLLAAYRTLPAELRRQYGLVISGKIDWRVDDIVADIDRGDPEGTIMRTNYVADEDMPGLYAGASAFTFPSSYEGFGMPALEAMACGVPVITSNISSLPEIVEGVGIMVDPHDVKGLSSAMANVVSNRQLAAELSRKGRERAENFSWDHSGRALKAVIDRVLAD